MKVTRNISLIDTDELNTYAGSIDPEVVLEKKSKFNKYEFEPKHSVQELKEQSREYSNSNSQRINTEAQKKKIQKLREENAAKKIQRAYRNYVETVREREREREMDSMVSINLQEIVKDQIGWREAQMLSIEYLREKELEDMRSLTEVFGHHSQVEEMIIKTVSQRYEQFTKIFKENLDNIESEIIDRMDTNEIVDFSNQIQKKRDKISKLIEETNLNNSLSRQELEYIFKETQQSDIITTDTSKSKRSIEKKKKPKSHHIKRHFPKDHLEIEFQSDTSFSIEKPPSPRASIPENIPHSLSHAPKDQSSSHLTAPSHSLKEPQGHDGTTINPSKDPSPSTTSLQDSHGPSNTKEIHSTSLNPSYNPPTTTKEVPILSPKPSPFTLQAPPQDLASPPILPHTIPPPISKALAPPAHKETHTSLPPILLTPFPSPPATPTQSTPQTPPRCMPKAP